MFSFFFKKARLQAALFALIPVLLAGLTISAALTFTGCSTGDSTTTYTVTKGTITGQGVITADKENAAAGETVTLTIDPATGWELHSVTVTAATGTNPTVSGNGNTFTMPASNVTFNGVFVETANTYTVTKGTITGQGDITADKEDAAEGDTVTLTIDPASDWELHSVTVTAEAGANP
ncbi:MAG: hypothetical protein FWF55_03015, partial [Treponema sp.]|nr:hypothetical protein [Treponema sp.]